MQLFFEDLALPRLLRTHIGDNPLWKSRRAGYSRDGTPNNLAVVRTMRGALGRRIALTKAPQRELQEKKTLLAAAADATADRTTAPARPWPCKQRIAALQRARGKVAVSGPHRPALSQPHAGCPCPAARR
jgi:uncharacterized sporulation protein YeaH/YhbH (DUF444 family)